MERMAESIMNVATTLPEGVPLAAKGLLHLGSRAAVDHRPGRASTRSSPSSSEPETSGSGIHLKVPVFVGLRNPNHEHREAFSGEEEHTT